ncbi:MAG: gliding motility-associated C-terminal domain-containing protein [Saprospiraceae bacterium]|nr:gliding motility-associated C-terminal domain-containing protein [Saprospiraceae bacterium]
MKLQLHFFIILLFSIFHHSLWANQNAPRVEIIMVEGPQHRYPLQHWSGDVQRYDLCNLEVGRTYRLIISEYLDTGCGWNIVSKNGSGKQKSSADELLFVADASCMSLWLQRQCPSSGNEGAVLSLQCEDCSLPNMEADEKMMGIMATANGNALYLIQQVFIGGGCFDVSGAVAAGAPGQIGTFNNGASSIGIGQGIILSTGNVVDCAGPNNSPSRSTGYGGGSSDPDLNQIAGGSLYDLAKLEFYFRPTVNSITFAYAFASEEYCEYANTQFNDVFGFFISGPGINGPFSGGAINIAVLADGSPVSINNINHTINQPYYHDNNPPGQSAGCNTGEAFSVPNTQFDGFTVPLLATATVIPCQQYKIKLVIADRGDAIYDSAVFLKENSFVAGSTLSASASVTGLGPSAIAAYEGCGNGSFTFFRQGDLGQPYPVTFTVSGSSTATSGTDYAPFPTTVIIPAGQNSITIPVQVFDDLINEGVEFIMIELQNPCSCTSSMVQLQIHDPPPLSISVPDVYVCSTIPTTITPTVSGGLPGFNYQWSTGGTSPTMTLTPPPGASFYSVQVSDNCGQSATANFGLFASSPTATLSGSGTICQGNFNALLDVEFTGFGPFDITYSVGGSQQTINGIYANPFELPVNLPGTVQLISVSANGCPGQASGTGTVGISEVLLDSEVTPISCNGAANGAIDITPSGGDAPYTYNWNGSLPDVEDVINLGPGTYRVTVTDDVGCEVNGIYTLTQPPVLNATVGNIQAVDCNNAGNGVVNINVSGGTPGYTYLWSDNSTTAPLVAPSGLYLLTVTDANGCTKQLSATIPNNVAYPTAVASVDDVLDCNTFSTTLNSTGSSTGAPHAYQWVAPPGVSITGPTQPQITVNTAGNYSLVITNTSNGCKDTATVSVVQDVIPPPIAIANPDTITCTVQNVAVDGSASASGPTYTYAWTTQGGNILSGSDAPVAQAGSGGNYTLVVTNTANGCTSTLSVAVPQNVNPPTVLVSPPSDVTCDDSEIQLNAGASSTGPQYQYTWSTSDGHIVSGNGAQVITVDEGGTYALQILNTQNGCQAANSVLVLQNQTYPVADAGLPIELNCQTSSATLNGANSSTGGNFTYQWTTSGNGISSGESSLNPIVNEQGWYYLMVENVVNGCVSIDSVQVLANSNAPNVAASVADILTCETTAINIDATSSDSGPDFNISWSSVEGNPIQNGNSLQPTVTAPGTYILTITNQINSCISTVTAVVDQDIAAPVAEAGPATTLNCYSPEYTIDASASDSGPNFEISWQTADGAIDSGIGTLTPVVSTPGTYVLTIKNTVNGCSTNDNVTILADQAAPNAAAGPDAAINCATSSIALQGQVITPAVFDFYWEEIGNPAFVSPNTLTPVITQGGQYALVVTNPQNGCLLRDTVVIAENFATPTAVAGQPGTLTCELTSFTINAQASSQGAEYNYQWTTLDGHIVSGPNSLSPQVDQPGTYQLVITNTTSQCRDTASLAIDQDIAYPVAEAGSPFELSCTDPSYTLTGTGSSQGAQYHYLWIGPGVNQDFGNNPPVLTVSQPGTYTLQVTNMLNGCESDDAVDISSNQVFPDALAGPDGLLNCAVNTVTLSTTGSSIGAGYTLTWKTLQGALQLPAGSLAPTIGQAGVFELMITNTLNGCIALDTVAVATDYTYPVADAGLPQTLTCTNTVATLSGAGSSQGDIYTYSWTTTDGHIISGNNSLSPDIDEPGLYQLEVFHSVSFCRDTAWVSIGQDILPPVAAIATPPVVTCKDPTRMLQATANGNHPLTYLWTTGDGNILSGNMSLTPMINAAGIYQLLVTNTGNGCTTIATATVTIDTLHPVAEAGPTAVLNCYQPDMSLNGSGSSTGIDYAYLWSTPNGAIAGGINTLTPMISLPGTYQLLVTNTVNGCQSEDEVLITQNVAPPQIALANPGPLTCATTTVNIVAGTDETTTPYTYVWHDASGNTISAPNVLSLQVSQPGAYYLVATNTANGCESDDQVIITQDITPPAADAGQEGILTCVTPQLSLSGAGSSVGSLYAYNWTGSQPIVQGSTTLNPVINQPGTYTLQVTNLQNGCTAQDFTTVIEQVPSEAEIQAQNPFCFGDFAVLRILEVEGGYGPYLYSIDGGNTFTTSSFYPRVEPGNYTVVVQDANGCEYGEFISIPEPVEVQVEVEAQVRIRLGDSYQINALVNIPVEEIGSIQWSPAEGLSCTDCLTPLATPTQTTTYTLRITNINGCPDVDRIMVVVDREPAIYVPNAFSPYNNDGFNDRFVVYAKPNAVKKVNSLMIFNRWGELMYEVYDFPPNDPQYGWDGLHRGQMMNPAVFVYWTEVELIDGTTVLLKGDVTLMD